MIGLTGLNLEWLMYYVILLPFLKEKLLCTHLVSLANVNWLLLSHSG